MNIVLIIFGLIVVAFFAWGFLSRSNTTDGVTVEVGEIKKLNSLVAKLMSSNNDHAYLGIRPTDYSEFFQLTADAKSARIDFPLMTKKQKALASKVTEIAILNKFPLQESKGSNGDRFLDIEITGSANQISTAVKILVEGVFDIKSGSKIEYRYWGI